MKPSATKKPRGTLFDRFWSKVDKKSPTDCWLWTASTYSKGWYGKFAEGPANGKNLIAHRVSWEFQNGPIPKGLRVLHNCPGGDNPLCVNPSHLFLGTHKDNIQDCIKKKRFACHNLPKFKGENHPAVKLTEVQVREIRSSNKRQVDLAKEYGVGEPCIHRIVKRKGWKHIL